MPAQRLRRSFLGLLSVVVGIVALISIRIPSYGYGPAPIAIAGIALGLTGLLFSILLGRTGGATPMLGVLLGVAALGVTYYNNGTLSKWIARIHPAAPSSTPATHSAPPPQATPSPAASTPHVKSIFDDDSDGSDASPAHVSRSSPPVAPTASVDDARAQNPAPAAPQLTLEQAKANVQSATAALERLLKQNPDYVAALRQADEANANRLQALSTDGPASPSAMSASQNWIDARSAIRKARDAAIAANPEAQAAERQLAAAQANFRAARKPQ